MMLDFLDQRPVYDQLVNMQSILLSIVFAVEFALGWMAHSQIIKARAMRDE